MHRTRLPIIASLAALLLAGCGKDTAPGTSGATGEDGLPKPDAVSGSVTGMPNPGQSTPTPGPADAPAPLPHIADIPPEDRVILPGESNEMPAVDEPGEDAAVAVLRDYYAAINAKDYNRAFAMWRQNPQSPAQFAEGFANTTGVSLEIGPPGRIDAGAGQRHIDIPVRLQATQADGRVDQYAGTYVLHRSVVEGGNPDWRIERATLAKQ